MGTEPDKPAEFRECSETLRGSYRKYDGEIALENKTEAVSKPTFSR